MTDGTPATFLPNDDVLRAVRSDMEFQNPRGDDAARTVVERPPPGLQRGKYAWPAWGIAALGAAIVIAGIAYLLWRRSRSRRRTLR